MRRHTLAAILLPALLLAAPAPAEPIPHWGDTPDQLVQTLGPDFKTYKTKHFVVVSDAQTSLVRSRLGVLEKARQQFFRFTDRLELDIPRKHERLVCVLFANHGDYEKFALRADRFSAPWAGGYYSPTANRIVLFDDRTSPAYLRSAKQIDAYRDKLTDLQKQRLKARRARDAELSGQLDQATAQLTEAVLAADESLDHHLEVMSVSKIVHETIHQIAHNTGVQVPGRLDPIWFSEGLATCFETESTVGAFGPGKPFAPREDELAALLAAGKTIPTENLVSLNQTPEDTVAAVYAQSHALFDHLATRKREDMAAFIHELMDTPIGEPIDHLAMFTRHFGPPSRYDPRVASAE